MEKYEWPVPLPVRVEREDIRTELLRQGAEHVWMDILCLRQAWDEILIRTGPVHAYNPFDLQAKTRMQRDGWKIDIPTIGGVYHTHSLARPGAASE